MVSGGVCRGTAVALATLALVAASGCDTIRARSAAQDGVALYKDGKPNEACAKFEEAQKLDPTIPTVWIDLGFASLVSFQGAPHTPAGEVAGQRAIFAFEKYLELKPGEERVLNYLVQTFVDTGRYADAEKFFRAAVEKSPPDSQALATLGTIASKVDRFTDAAHWFQKRIDAEPDNGDARVALAVLLWDRLSKHVEIDGKERVDLANRALDSLKEARRLQPNSPNAFLYMNLVYRQRANTKLTEETKNDDLALANAYFHIAAAMGKGEHDEKKLAADKKVIDDMTPVAAKAVAAPVAALPPPCVPGQPCTTAPCVPGQPCTAPAPCVPGQPCVTPAPATPAPAAPAAKGKTAPGTKKKRGKK